MSRIKKILLVVAVTIIAMLGAGCGGTLKTEFTMDESLSGQRVMTFTCERSETDSKVTGDYAEISATVAANTPDVLKFEDVSTDTDITYIFTLEFKDLNEYANKVNSLMEYNGEVITEDLLVYELPDSIFETGINYKENFTSGTLMAWFPKLLAEKGYITEDNVSNVFYNTSADWLIWGEEKNTYSESVEINSFRRMTLGSITLYTTINPDGTVDRKIAVSVPKELMSANETGVRNYFEARTPAGADASWSEYGYDYEVARTSMNVDEVNAFMSAFCGEGKNCSFKLETSDADWPENYLRNPLHECFDIVENYDLSGFNEAYNGENPVVNYWLSEDNAIYFGSVKNGESEKAFNTACDHCVEGYEATYDYTCFRAFDLLQAAVDLDVKMDGKVERTLTLIADVVPTEYIKKNVLARAEKTAASVNEEDGTMTVSSPSDKDSKSLTLIIKVNAEADKEAKFWKDTYNLDNKLTVTIDGGALAFKKKINVRDEFALGYLSKKGIATATYCISGIGKAVDGKCFVYFGSVSDEMTQGKGKYRVDTEEVRYGDTLILKAEGERINTSLIVIIIVTVVALLAIVAVVIVILLKKKKNAAPVMNNAAPVEKKTEGDTFCTSCGAQIAADAGFCTSCGAKQ